MLMLKKVVNMDSKNNHPEKLRYVPLLTQGKKHGSMVVRVAHSKSMGKGI